MHENAKFKKLVMHENTESFWRVLHEYTKFKTRVLHEYTKCLVFLPCDFGLSDALSNEN